MHRHFYHGNNNFEDIVNLDDFPKEIKTLVVLWNSFVLK